MKTVYKVSTQKSNADKNGATLMLQNSNFENFALLTDCNEIKTSIYDFVSNQMKVMMGNSLKIWGFCFQNGIIHLCTPSESKVMKFF